MFRGPFDESIIKRAQDANLADIRVRNLRDWTQDRHRKTDDEQYGGGDGMVMLAQPLIDAARAIQTEAEVKAHIILTTPQGRLFNQATAEELSAKERLLIICGHYKGIDERVIDILQPDEISIGDYVLTGGELPAMVLVDAVTRLLPGVVGSFNSVAEDSFTSGLLDCPRYTRPRELEGRSVPEVLLSGNHAVIERWRYEQALERTSRRRPDLFEAHRKSRGSDGDTA